MDGFFDFLRVSIAPKTITTPEFDTRNKNENWYLYTLNTESLNNYENHECMLDCIIISVNSTHNKSKSP